MHKYVMTLNLNALGFEQTEEYSWSAQPPFNPVAILKLYIFGYQNKIGSSRSLEKMTRTYLEVQWLLGSLDECQDDIRYSQEQSDGLAELTLWLWPNESGDQFGLPIFNIFPSQNCKLSQLTSIIKYWVGNFAYINVIISGLEEKHEVRS